MKLLITGGDGFIGKHLTKRVDNYVVADLKSGTDINSNKFNAMCREYRPDVIVHLAADSSTPRSIQDPKTNFVDNVMGTFNVLEMAREIGAKVHFTSSVKAGTGTPYGTSKECGELYVQDWGSTYGVPYIINRPGTIYGEGQSGSEESGWVDWFVRASLQNKPITIYGDGNQVRRILHVDDYVHLILNQLLIFDEWQGIWDVDGGIENEVSLLDVLSYLEYDNYKHEDARINDVIDYPMAQPLPGFKPIIYWESGLHRLIKYYKD